MNEEITASIVSICVISGLSIFGAFILTWQQIGFLKDNKKYLMKEIDCLEKKMYELKDELRELKYKMPRKD